MPDDTTNSSTTDTNGTDTPADAPHWWDDVEPGTRADAVVSDDVRREYLRAGGKGYWVDVREPTWKQVNDAVSDALTIGEEATQLDLTQFQLDVLEEMIVDISVDGGVRSFLVSVGPTLGEQLTDLAPDPSGTLAEAEEGNSGGLSEGGEPPEA
jgi:hypothetical protein